VIDLNAVDRTMRNTQFASGEAAESYWHHLLCQISLLRRPGDNFTVPPLEAAHAWRTAFEIYTRLRDRANKPPDPARVAAVANEAAREEEWNRYLNNRALLLEYVRRDQIDENAAQYLGLLPGDLNSPTSNGPEAQKYGGRRPDWLEIAGRLETAVGQWEDMSPEERRAIPHGMAARRAEAATARLEQRLAAIETANLNQLENAHA
jgi:hypothetical protein